LLIQTFNFAEDADILPIVLHQNNLRPMYEKWPHGEQARWWTHAERYSFLEQAVHQGKIPGDRSAGLPGSNQHSQQRRQLPGRRR
jgi:hypothetical protein